MISRFELFVVLRNQVRDRTLVRRALALEAVATALARALGADEQLWGLAALGADIDLPLTAQNPARRGQVAEEILVTEGVPAEAAAAARARFELDPETMPPLPAALVVASALVDIAFAQGLDELEAIHLSFKLSRAARRGDLSAERALACFQRLGLDLDATAAAAVAALSAVREDLGP